MRISIPYFLRSQAYRRTIRRRLGERRTIQPLKQTPTMILFADGLEPYSRSDFQAGPCYLPPDRPKRSRWWLHPLFFAGLASILIGVVLALLERAV
jgi:hypothetical protein